MPVNDWDFLMGDRMSAGHEANTYTLEDWTQLVSEYSRFLEPFLSIADPIDPLDSAPSKSQFQTLEKLTLENAQLKEQIVKLTDVLTKKFS